MKVNYLTLLAGATLTLLSAAATRADESAVSALAAEANAAPATKSTSASTAPVATVAGGTSMACVSGDTATYCQDCDPVQDFIARAGAWGVHSSGSPTKVGEYQNLDSSPFYNADGLWSNGDRTIDFSVTGSDNETDVARLHYFGSHLEADLDYERFQHQLDAHQFAGFNFNGNNSAGPSGPNQTGVNGSNNIVLYTDNDLSPGQDFAIRVQEWKANFKGNLTDNLKWRLNVFGIDKEGERQVNEFQHCSAAAGNGSGLQGPLAAGSVGLAGGQLPPGGVSIPGVFPIPPGDNNQYPPKKGPIPANAYPDGQTWTALTSQCHVTSQSQHIDWQTTEVTPTLEWRLGCDTVLEYSHTFRDFTANDQAVTFNYDASATYSVNPAAINNLPNPAPTTLAQGQTRQAAINNLTAGYAIVPDNQTNIDRLKFSTKIGQATDLYLLGYAGYNEDELRDTYRNFEGTDLRITNRSIETLTMTFYGKYYNETSTSPLTQLTPTGGTANNYEANNYYQEPTLGSGAQINRQDTAFGINGRWRPFQDECGTLRSRLAFVGGWEYSSLKRENAGDTFNNIAATTGQFLSTSGTNAAFTQPDSNKNTFTAGVEERWAPCFNTFLRYKFISTDYPLYGITPDAGQVDAALNSALPTQENRVELGCTWMPTDCLMVNATLYVENAMSDAPYVAWTSNSLPFTVSAWWAPTTDWSFSAGAAEMDSWINQNTNLSNLNAPNGPVIPIPWQYTGVADVFNLGSRYRATEKLSFTGEIEYVHGINTSSAVVDTTKQQPAAPPAYIATSYNIGQYSDVKMQSIRLGLGADYLWRPRVTMYARYNYYDYQDIVPGLTSGQTSMLLGGMSAKF